MSTPGNAGGGLPGDIRENQISSSQEGLHNLGEHEGMIHPLGDPDNQEFAQDGQEFDMNLDENYVDALRKIDNQFKRNKVSSFLLSIKDDLAALKGAMLDQVQSSLLEEDFQDILGKVAVYAGLASTLADIPGEVDASQEVKDFINVQKQEFADLQNEMRDTKSKIQRIVSGDAKMRAAMAQVNRSSAPSSSASFLKLPRLQIPQFQDNTTGTVNWTNFHSILMRLTTGMKAEEKIFLLKSSLSGKSKKLIANEQDFDNAIRMLRSCFGNELIETQTKIQEFVAMIIEEPTEKTNVDANRDLWQRCKMFSNYIGQQIDAKGHESVLSTIICALVLQRLPYSIRQLTIRSRRERETATGKSLNIEELLDLYNSLIHDVEIASTSRDSKKKPERSESEDKRSGKANNAKRGTSRSLVTKAKPNKKGKCVLCDSVNHSVRSHHLDKHGVFALDEIKRVLADNNRCSKCAAFMDEDGSCIKGDCKNITRPCYHCGSLSHHNILCPNPKSGSAAITPGLPGGEEF